jgi:hypothetical protein
MRCANFSRRKDSRRNRVTHRFQVAGDSAKSVSDVLIDVFDEYEGWLTLPNDSGDMRPEMTRVRFSKLFSSTGEWLARDARKDNIHDSTPIFAFEGFDTVPYRSFIQRRFFHPRHESRCATCVPLNVTYSSVGFSEGELNSKFHSSNPGA